MTAFQYDWNMLPIGQQLWLKHLESYITYPPLQAAASYNLTQVIEQVKKAQSQSRERVANARSRAEREARKREALSPRLSSVSKISMPRNDNPLASRSTLVCLILLVASCSHGANTLYSVRGLSSLCRWRSTRCPRGTMARRRQAIIDFRARQPRSRAIRNSCRRRNASPPSTRTARRGSRTRCTPRCCSAFDRVAALAPQHPEWKTTRAIQAVLSRRQGGDGEVHRCRTSKFRRCHPHRHDDGGVPGDREGLDGDGEASALQPTLYRDGVPADAGGHAAICATTATRPTS